MENLTNEEQKMFFDSLAEVDYEFYAEYVNPEYVHGQHTKYVCNLLSDIVENDRGGKYIITMPPQHSKSYTITETFPSFYLGNFPTRSVITVGYSGNFAEKFGRKNLNKIREYGSDVFGVQTGEKETYKDWTLEHGGRMLSSGIGGQITGERADCLVGSTKIETEQGKMKIKNVVNKKPKVLSYNHKNDELEYREVVAHRKEHTDTIIKFTTSKGNTIECTPRHRFYVMGEGYKEAQNIRQGDRFANLRATGKKKSGLPSMRKEKNNRNLSLSRLLFRDKKDKSQNKMRLLWKKLFYEITRGKEQSEEKLREPILLKKMSESVYFREILSTLSGLWRKCSKRQQRILLNGLLCQSNEKEQKRNRRYRMSRMWENVFRKFKEKTILFKRLCRQGSFFENEGERKFSLQRWNKLFQMVFGSQASYQRQGQLQMSRMWSGRTNQKSILERPGNRKDKFSNTPYRPKTRKLSSRKSNNSMPKMPHNPSQIETVEVQKVERVHKKNIPVYDIQVEETSNFFAEEILTHNCLLIDDPVKNRQDANNKRYRDRLWDEWENTLSTRLAENSLVILIQTLWHEDGLAGRLMEREEEKWNVLKFPALSPGKEQDILGREKDEPLWPFQYSKEYLEERRRDLDSKTWNSLYMCAPNIEQGNQFKSIYFRYFRENDDKSAFILEDNEKRVILKSRCVPFQTVDSSFKKKNRHDPTVISTWYLTPNNDILLYNVYKDRISVPDLFPTLESLMDRYKPVKVFVEDKASGTGIIQTAKRKGRPVIAVPSQNDKVTKSFEISSFYENRAVYHKQDTEWVADYEDELTKFPETSHDDQVDTASIAGMVVSRNFLRAGESSGGFVTSI